MTDKTDIKKLGEETGPLSKPEQNEQQSSQDYILTPFPDMPAKKPVWRVRFDVMNNIPVESIKLAINGDIVLGTLQDESNVINLCQYNAQKLGVSRRHLMLIATDTGLFAFDLNSTNGTYRNGQPLPTNTPRAIHDGDILLLGHLQLAVHILEGPGEWTASFMDERDMASALVHLAAAITSQLKLDDVLDQILELTINFTNSCAAALWLIDEETENLMLRAERGIGDLTTKLMKIPADDEHLVSQAIHTQSTLRISRRRTGGPIKVKTGYLVEAALFIPLFIGDIPIGVLMATHLLKDKDFSTRDEQRLSTIGKFAVIAIKNSRAYEETTQTLAKRVNELAAINEISLALSAASDMKQVYDVLRSHISKHWKVENIGLWLFNETSKKLVPFPKPTFHKPYDVGEGLIGQVAKSMKPQLGNNYEIPIGTLADSSEAKHTTLRIGSLVACVPLLMKNRVIGVLAIFSRKTTKLDNEDLKLLHALASPIAAAIQNAQLFSYVEGQRATMLATINMLPHPLMIVNQQCKLVFSNEAADLLLKEVQNQAKKDQQSNTQVTPLLQLLEGLSESRWSTKEVKVGDKVYMTTVEEASWVGTIILMQDVTRPKGNG